MTLQLLPSDYIVYAYFFPCIAAAFYIRTQPHYREPWKKVFQNKVAIFSAVILSIYVVIGLLDSIHFSNQKSALDLLIAHLNSHDEKTYSAPFATPFLHVFGTNKIGEDVFYLSIKSIRTGLIIGTLTTIFMLPFALICGLLAGYFGGIVDDIIQYLYTTLSSIPGVLLITAMMLVMEVVITNHPQLFPTIAERADARLLLLCLILGITSWSGLCRLLRAENIKTTRTRFCYCIDCDG
jgi:ABC-type dipeptide/oligopeptide/nickel transport systems, permease components